MMSTNQRAVVEKIAELAKLEFAPDALDRFVPSFEEILGFFKQLEGVETSQVEPTYHALQVEPLETPLRDDECGPSLDREAALQGAPESRDGHFLVPKVIE